MNSKQSLDEVQVFVVKTQDYTNYEHLHCLLSVEEKKRADRFLFKKDKHDFVIAHALKREKIADQLNISDPTSIYFENSPSGKPYLKGSALHFNISHSHGWVALVISQKSECGIDIESYQNRRLNQLPLLIDKTMSELEKSAIDNSSNRLYAFIDRWVLKEAYLKKSGVGLAVNLNAICTEFDSISHLDYKAVLDSKFYIKKNQDYSLSMCMSDIENVRFHSHLEGNQFEIQSHAQ